MSRLAIFGGSFNPPGKHHVDIVKAILQQNYADEVIVIPSGKMLSKNYVSDIHRKKLINMSFSNIPNCKINYMNIDLNIFTSNYKYEKIFSCFGSIYHVLGEDQLNGEKESRLIKFWEYGQELFYLSKFIVVPRLGYNDNKFLPPHSLILNFENTSSSLEIITKIQTGEDFSELVEKGVCDYILHNQLFKGLHQ